MAPELRYYQREAVDAIFEYWRDTPGNPLVDMATGVGKSLTMATLTKEVVTEYKDIRVLTIAHRRELVSGNFSELERIWHFAPAGIYAAALNRRDHHAQILFAQINTVYNKARQIGHVDILEIDEVHLVPVDEETMYRQFIADLLAINPDMKIVGFSATLYRTNEGRLDQGDDRLFDKVVYEYGIARGIDDGYLAPLSSKPTLAGFDLTGVGLLGGDYKKNSLNIAVDRDEITQQAVAETIAAANASNRQKALFFCAGVDHAIHVRDAVREHGRSCEVIHGKTKSNERDQLLADYNGGAIWGMTNDAVLTVGTNIPGIDLIADLGPTQSTSRFVQKAGRGTRPIYMAGFVPHNGTTKEERKFAIANGPKPNCLYLDYAKNVLFHGPVDMAQPREKGKGSGEAPVKQCPQCDELIHISVMKCHCCGYDFPPSEEIKLTANAGSAPIISTDIDMWRAVTRRSFAEHPGKEGKPDSVKTSFSCGLLGVNNWLCPGHTGFAKTKADRFWRDHGGKMPYPANAVEWLMRQLELNDTAEIELEYNGKYANAKSYRASGTATALPDDEYEVERDYRPVAVAKYSDVLDDDFIPF